MPSLDALLLGDQPAAWEAAGFVVETGAVRIGDTVLRCTGDGGGHDRWVLRADHWSDDRPDQVDGIATSAAPSLAAAPPSSPPPAHPNRVASIDHVVLRSPDLDRTTDALVGLGLDLRRIRDVPLGDHPIQQRFFRFDNAIVELVGPPEPAGDGPATIWGLALVSDDIDVTAALLGDRCSAPKDAVQPGRRIATLRTDDLGIAMSVAFMTPHVRRPA